MKAKNVNLTPEQIAGGVRLLDQQLSYEVERYVFGRAAELRRRTQDDAQVRAALDLFRNGATPGRIVGAGRWRAIRQVSIERVAIIGGGRVGLSLARALARSGRAVAVLGRHAEALPAPLEPATAIWEPAIAAADLILIAVPDDAIGDVALALARGGAVGASHVVLHTSGLHDRTALAALYSSRAASRVVASAADVCAGRAVSRRRSPDRRSSSRAISARSPAVANSPRCCTCVRSSRSPPSRRPLYHAAAVIASNYLVVLADMATRLARNAAGGPVPDTFFLPLMRRAAHPSRRRARGRAHRTDRARRCRHGRPASRGAPGTGRERLPRRWRGRPCNWRSDRD